MWQPGVIATYDTCLKFVGMVDGLRPTTGQIVDVNVGSVRVFHHGARCVRVHSAVRVTYYAPITRVPTIFALFLPLKLTIFTHRPPYTGYAPKLTTRTLPLPKKLLKI